MSKFVFKKKSKELWCKYQTEDGECEELLWSDVEYPYLVRDMDSNELSMFLSMQYAGRNIEQLISLNEVQQQSLKDYSKYGFPFYDTATRKLICQWLQDIIPTLNIVDVTKDIGWKYFKDTTYFQLEEAISKVDDFEVKYKGDMLIGSKGSFEKYKAILNKHVIPYTQTQVIVAFSVASALATYLNPDLTLTLHMNGESTTGKTTMLKLAASVWGSTEVDTNGIIQTWNTTKNAMINAMCGFNGITLCYDELGVSETDTSNLSYLISNGTDKKRMGVDKIPKKFSVNICSSGEIPLKTLEAISGMDARLLELSVQWTESKQHSDELKSALEKCYGLLGKEFVKALLGIPKAKLQDYLAKTTDKIMDKFSDKLELLPSKNKRIVKRAIEKIAVVDLTARILKKNLGLDFKPSKISEFMLMKSQLFNMPDDECITMVEEYIQSKKIESLKQDKVRNTAVKQPYDEIIDGDYKCVPKQHFYDVLHSLGYSKKTIINNLKELRNRKIIRCEPRKLYNRHQVDKNRLTFIDFDIKQLQKEGVDCE